MTEYKIGRTGFAYLPDSDIIEIHKLKDDYSKLTDKELLILISDSLTHEFIHSLLHKKFNLTVSKLFDTIGHLFYVNYKLMDKCSQEYSSVLSWKDYIKINGIQSFFDNYRITDNDLKVLDGGI